MVEHLPSRHKAPSSIPGTKKNLWLTVSKLVNSDKIKTLKSNCNI